MQHVVDAVKAPRLFDGGDIRWLLYHANQALVTGRAAAIHARIDIRDVVANRAEMKAGFDLADRIGQKFCIFVACAEDVEGKALRRLTADARQLFKFVDEPRHGLCKFRQLILTGAVIR